MTTRTGRMCALTCGNGVATDYTGANIKAAPDGASTPYVQGLTDWIGVG